MNFTGMLACLVIFMCKIHVEASSDTLFRTRHESTPDAKQLHFPPLATPKSNVKKRLG
jgi:hypothetical protein